MAGSNKATKKTGVTHFPLQEEKNSAARPSTRRRDEGNTAVRPETGDKI
jgi:hypothetical protein